MRLTRIQKFLKDHSIDYTYTEENDAGSIDFLFRGITYHVWEYPAPERGACANLHNIGRQEDYEGDYETALLNELELWNLPESVSR